MELTIREQKENGKKVKIAKGTYRTTSSGEPREKEEEHLLKKIAENLPNPGKETDLEIQEAQTLRFRKHSSKYYEPKDIHTWTHCT